MHETELWITKLFNDYLPGVGNTLTRIVGVAPEARPWGNFVTMQLLVAAIIVILFAFLKPRLSADRPGKLQHTFELVYDFVREQADEQVGHGSLQYVAYFGTIFIFILFCNLIGIVPGMESPTMVPSVPAGPVGRRGARPVGPGSARADPLHGDRFGSRGRHGSYGRLGGAHTGEDRAVGRS